MRIGSSRLQCGRCGRNYRVRSTYYCCKCDFFGCANCFVQLKHKTPYEYGIWICRVCKSTPKESVKKVEPVLEKGPSFLPLSCLSDADRKMIKYYIYERDRGCVYCRKKIAFSEMTLDHLIPVSKGGIDSFSNLVCSCSNCNENKADLLPLNYIVKSCEVA